MVEESTIHRREAQSCDTRHVVIAAGWCLAGIACIAIDGRSEQILTSVGQLPAIHISAAVWQQFGSTLGIGLFLSTAFIAIRADQGRTLKSFATSIFVASLIVQVMKRVVGRLRPYAMHGPMCFYGPFATIHLGLHGASDSMPSGHTTAAFAMAVALGYRWPHVRWLWIILASGVAVARVVLNAHFLSDVVLGALLGTIVSVLVNRGLNRFEPEPIFDRS